MHGWMNRWIDGLIDRWRDGWIDEWIDGWMGQIGRVDKVLTGWCAGEREKEKVTGITC